MRSFRRLLLSALAVILSLACLAGAQDVARIRTEIRQELTRYGVLVNGAFTSGQASDQDLTDIAGITRTRGDLVIGGASAWQDLAVGAANTVLVSNGTDPSWSGTPTVTTLTSTQSTGTAPFVVASTTVVTNLNADLLDGISSAGFQTADTQLTDLAGLSYSGNSLKVVRVNAGETGWEVATVSGNVVDTLAATLGAGNSSGGTNVVITALDGIGLGGATTPADDQIAWGTSGAGDVGLARSAADILKVTNGSTGLARLQVEDLDGTNPAIFGPDGNDGLYFIDASDAVGFVCNGAGQFQVTPTSVQITPVIHATNTSGIEFGAEVDVGIARGAAGIAKVTDGATGDGRLAVHIGTAASPGYQFDDDPNTGIAGGGADDLYMVAGGSSIARWGASGLAMLVGNVLPGASGRVSWDDVAFSRSAARVMRVDDGTANVIGALQYGVVLEVAAADDTLTIVESGATVINSGAATRTLTLPTTTTTGVTFRFVSDVSGQVLRIDPGAAEKFVGLAGGWADGEYMELDQNEAVEICSKADGDWVVTWTRGTPAEQTP